MSDSQAKGPGNEHQKEYSIIVNAREKKWPKDDISYEEVVKLAFPDAQEDPNIVYTVNYKKGNHGLEEGSLVKGGKSVTVKNGMIFNVTSTNKS
jgi:hypothetical protein